MNRRRGWAGRNSSIEVLRILAMFLITSHHLLAYGVPDLLTSSLSVNKVLLETFLYSGGKIGVVIFFLISAWYLPVDGTLKSCFRRVWLLEREVLFWSLALLACSMVFNRAGVGTTLVASSVLPTATSLWWYVTAYAVFLLVFPFLAKGLRALGAREHLALCMVGFVMWTVGEGFVPFFSLGLPGGDFLSFVYIYTLLSYYRWHMQAISARAAWVMLAVGYGLLLFSAAVGGLAYERLHVAARMQVYFAAAEFKLVPLLVGFGLFSLFVRREFHSAVVNRFASTMLATYLITEYPAMRKLVWQRLIPVESFSGHWYTFIAVCAAVVAVMVAAGVLDLLRQTLFSLTIDRHRGRLFDRLWDSASDSKLVARIQRICLPADENQSPRFEEH
ncbi:proline symporter [Bifidobacterium lemurum]|uniref:Proline symporter n=1 Tax=Bifidobacterium lemurum TaxID=1603886 RepID=A0A261FQ81_9BIFI|nr:acyltransferase [Bifidobacterium lemurum]OZG61317.1 proline symporter [Bifidobacterium lemurum]QOL34706.1 acyltransferase [Bifidobacterium lemurum]